MNYSKKTTTSETVFCSQTSVCMYEICINLNITLWPGLHCNPTIFFPLKSAAQFRFNFNSRNYYLIFIILGNSLAAISVNSKVVRCLQEDLNASLHDAIEH